MAVWNAQPEKGRREFPLSAPDYVDFRDRQDRLAAVAAHTGTSVAFVGTGEPRQIAGVLTTAELHAVLGVQPVLGRALTRGDSAPGAPPVILLGHTFWKNEFGGRPTVIGELVRVDGAATEIVGVLPDGIEFPNGSDSYWVPLTLDPAQFNRGSHFLSATGRLADGATIAQASDALNSVARALAEAYPSTNSGQAVELVDLKQQLNGDAPQLLAILGAAIGAVLLIACTNVASLLAVRASLRGPELALRTAIGATGRRLRHQLLTEHLLLAFGGAVLGLAMAMPLHRFLLEQRILALPKTSADAGVAGLPGARGDRGDRGGGVFVAHRSPLEPRRIDAPAHRTQQRRTAAASPASDAGRGRSRRGPPARRRRRADDSQCVAPCRRQSRLQHRARPDFRRRACQCPPIALPPIGCSSSLA